MQLGRVAEAIAHCEEARPSVVPRQSEYSVPRMPTHRPAATHAQCTTRLREVQALKIDATLASAYYNLANAHRNRKDVPDVNHGAAEVDRDSVNKEVL